MKRTTSARRVNDWPTIRDTIDLAAVITQLLGPPPGRRGEHGGRLWWPCPFHDDANPSFCVKPGELYWRCFGCGASGDAAELVMHLNGCTFPEAKSFLAGRSTSPAIQRRPVARPTAPPEPTGLDEADAAELVEASTRRLWTTEGTGALEYLRGRGLRDDTIRAARLGCTAGVTIPTREGKTTSARGVVIPWLCESGLALVKVRQPDGTRPKYKEAFRDPARVLHYPGVDAVHPGRALVISEGEFDALLLGQELLDLASVVTLGSSSARPSSAFLAAILAASPWFVATDGDDAGEHAAGAWPSTARRIRPPSAFKDWTEAAQGGVNLRRWWAQVLAGNLDPPLFTWEELATWRWGPAVNDPAPGIVAERLARPWIERRPL